MSGNTRIIILAMTQGTPNNAPSAPATYTAPNGITYDVVTLWYQKQKFLEVEDNQSRLDTLYQLLQ